MKVWAVRELACWESWTVSLHASKEGADNACQKRIDTIIEEAVKASEYWKAKGGNEDEYLALSFAWDEKKGMFLSSSGHSGVWVTEEEVHP